MSITLTTAAVAPEHRPDYWRETLRQHFQADHDITPAPGVPLSIECSLYHFGAVAVAEARGGAFGVRRLADPQMERVSLLFNLEGHLTVRQDGRRTELAPGQFALLPLRESVEFEMADDFRHLSLILAREQLSDLVPGWRQCLAKARSANGPAARLLTDFVRCLTEHGQDMEGPHARRIADTLASLAAALIETDAAPEGERSSRFEQYHRERIRRYICDNLRNPALNVDMIAQGVGLSTRYVHRLFASAEHSVMEWVWQQRLERAARDLADPASLGRPIGDIAYSWGFNDQAHFSRSFRKHFRTTPRAWRSGSDRAEQAA